eukprot:UN27011
MQISQYSAKTLRESYETLGYKSKEDNTYSMSDTSPTSYLTDKQFKFYMTCITFIVVIVTGFGLEILFGTYLSFLLSQDMLWWLWMLSQFLFPFCSYFFGRNDVICIAVSYYRSIQIWFSGNNFIFFAGFSIGRT